MRQLDQGELTLKHHQVVTGVMRNQLILDKIDLRLELEAVGSLWSRVADLEVSTDEIEAELAEISKSIELAESEIETDLQEVQRARLEGVMQAQSISGSLAELQKVRSEIGWVEKFFQWLFIILFLMGSILVLVARYCELK